MWVDLEPVQPFRVAGPVAHGRRRLSPHHRPSRVQAALPGSPGSGCQARHGRCSCDRANIRADRCEAPQPTGTADKGTGGLGIAASADPRDPWSRPFATSTGLPCSARYGSEQMKRCPACGGRLSPLRSPGRARVWCSEACRVWSYWQRLPLVHPPCETCGGPLGPGARREARFCSLRCAAKSRGRRASWAVP
jgi:hypothetical protein